MATELEYADQLRDAGFGIVPDGSALIVTGPAERIPIDRPTGAFDLLAKTRARRFESAKEAVRILIVD